MSFLQMVPYQPASSIFHHVFVTKGSYQLHWLPQVDLVSTHRIHPSEVSKESCRFATVRWLTWIPVMDFWSNKMGGSKQPVDLLRRSSKCCFLFQVFLPAKTLKKAGFQGFLKNQTRYIQAKHTAWVFLKHTVLFAYSYSTRGYNCQISPTMDVNDTKLLKLSP